MIISEKNLRTKIRKVLSELLGAKRKESILQRALGGSYWTDEYGHSGGGGYDDYYDDYDYGFGYDSDSDDGDDGDDGGE